MLGDFHNALGRINLMGRNHDLCRLHKRVKTGLLPLMKLRLACEIPRYFRVTNEKGKSQTYSYRLRFSQWPMTILIFLFEIS